MLKNTIILFFILILTNSTDAKIWKVDDTGYNTPAIGGTLTLPMAIAAASVSDTVLINISGTMSVSGPNLVFNKPLTIIGPNASHFTIDANSWEIIFGIPGGNINVEGIRFINSPCLCGNYLSVIQGTNLTLKNCVFDGIQTSGNGGAIRMQDNAMLNVDNSSFFNCLASGGNGGAIYIGTTNIANIRNCTFFSNTALEGGAVYNDGNALLVNNTFLNNTSTNATPNGHAVKDGNIAAGTVTRVQNNIFTDGSAPKLPDLLAGNAGDMWLTDGGNVYTNAGEVFLSSGPNDRFSEAFGNLSLRATAITDGYGLKYFTITSQTSTLIDNGTSGANVAFTDCRRAPRILYGDNFNAPDAGAAEFTPFTVTTNNSAGFFTTWGGMNSSVNAGPKYMDFDVGGIANYNISTTIDNLSTAAGTDWIVDGFTQEGSVVPGPGNSPNSVTPGIYFINISSSATPNVIHLNSPGTNSFIAGLSLNNSAAGSNAITIDGGSAHIYGNNINSSGSLGQIGINGYGSSSLIIGGQFHHNRNVVANEQFGLYLQNSYNMVQGNFIGTNPNGTTSQPNDVGIVAIGTTLEMKGKYRFPSMNLVSGNLNQQISIENLTYFRIYGSMIGPDYSGMNVITNTASGIDIYSNTDGYIGSGLPGDFNVIGGNAGGITIDAANSVTILGNYIGISPVPGFPAMPNVNGITLIGNGDANHFIGDGTFAGRNYISGNSNLGIYADNTSSHNIIGNFIGLNPGNNPAGNGSHGIWISNGSSNMNITGNIIGDNLGSGIKYDNSGSFDLIQLNRIGTDSTGNISRANSNGIYFNNAGSDVLVNNNQISGNSMEGILVEFTNLTLNIDNNIIGLNAGATASLPNQQGVVNRLGSSLIISNNTIAGNLQSGVQIADASIFTIRNNFIGTNSSIASGIGNGLSGIELSGTANAGIIGGTLAEANTIAFNLQAGIFAGSGVVNIGFLSNNIFDNSGLGIGLVNTNSPLVNDFNDVDGSGTAGNKGQNYPDDLVASFCSGLCTLTGNLDVNAAGDYIIQVFRINPGIVDASGHGEGNEFVFETSLNLPAGSSPISISLPPTILINDILSATATHFNGTYETSEFSDTVLVRGGFTATATVSNNVSCFGGTDGMVTVTHGGTAPFTYDWINVSTSTSTGVNTQNASLPAGTYTCMVTDAGCTIYSDTIIVTEPAPISISAVTYNVNCFGESTGGVDVTVTGGTGGYFFDWNNDGTGDFDDFEDLSGVPAGTYNVQVQDVNGCLEPGSNFTINQPGMISASSTVVNESCVGLNDGSITITAAGGTGGFNYQIDGGGFSPSSTFSGLAPGNYSIDVQDANACIVNLFVTVLAGENVIADFLVSTTTACQNTADFDLTDVSTSSSGIANWNFSMPTGSPSSGVVAFIPDVILFNAGVNLITLQVTSNLGCTDDTTMTVVTNPAVFVDAGPDAAICLGDDFIQSAIVSGGSGGNIFNWEPVAGHFVDNTIEDADVISSLENTIGYFEHILQVTDANGCTDRDTMYLDIRSLPSVNAGLDNSVCQGSAYTLAGSGSAISYTWDNGVIDGSPFTPLGTTTYTVTGTDASGCQNTDQVTIGVDLLPTVNAGADIDECRSTAFSASLNGFVTNAGTVQWTTSGSGGFVPNNSVNSTYTYSGADVSGANVVLTLTGISGNSCPNVSDNLVVTFHNAPSAFAGLDFSSCSGSPISLSGGATDYSSVDWTNGTGIFSPDNLSLTTSYIPSGAEISAGFVNLTFTAYATNVACADATDNITITLLTTPVANAGIDASICNGQTFLLDGTASTGGTIYSWDEVFGSNIGSNDQENVSPIVTTSYAFTIGNGSCSDSDTITLTVVTSPDASFAYSTTAYCQNDGVQTPTSIVTVGGTFTLPTSPGSINATTGDVDLSTLSVGVHKIYYTLTTPCFAVDSVLLNVFGLPTVNAGGDAAICLGNSIPLNGSGSGSLFSWSGTNGFVSNVANTNDSPTGTTTYTLTVTDANSCTNTDDVIITVNPTPIGTISGGGTFCEGDPSAGLIVTANGYSGGGDWDVQFYQNSSPAANATPPTGTYTLMGLGNSANNGTWTAEIIDNITGCIGTASGSVNINVNPEPGMSIVSPFDVCSGIATFDMNSIFIPNIVGGNWAGTGVSGSDFNPFSAGVGSFDVVYTLPSGCDDTIQIIVNPAPSVSISGVNNAYCVTDPPFTPIGTPVGGLWAIDGGTFTSLTTVDPSTLSQGTHSLSYQYTDTVTGCMGTTTPTGFVVSNVPLDPTPVSATSQSICAGTSLVLTVSNPNFSGTTIQWYSDAALTINVGSTINFTTPALTSSIIYYAVAQNAGCKSNPVIFDITVNAPQVSAGSDITICPGTPAQLNVTSVSGTISWSPGVSLDDSTIQNPLATPNVNTTYYVTVTSGPCSASDSVSVIIDGSNADCGVVPSYNAFSPDGDGVNDTWIIDAIFNHPDNTVSIFNRWGDKLVSFEDYDNVNIVWDGLYKGEVLPSGTYFYVIEYLDINIQVSGWLQLTR